MRTELLLYQVDLDENPLLEALEPKDQYFTFLFFFPAVTAVSRSKLFPPADLHKRSDGGT